MRKKMFFGASPLIFQRATELRNNMIEAELLLWGYLRQRPKSLKFRRQHPVGIYIADFYCHRLKLVIEVDGSVHDKEEVRVGDEKREELLGLEGLKVFRVKNEDVLMKSNVVFEKIYLLITELTKTC